MFSIDGLFGSKNRPHSADISSYPSRQYKKVLCSRPHCTEACRRPMTDPYKYWALFLSTRKVDREDLLAHLNTLPDRMRHAVYIHVLAAKAGLSDLPGGGEQLNRYADAGSGDARQASNTQEGEEQPGLQISKDSQLVQGIMEISGFFAYDHPEAAFRVYRSLEDKYPLSLDVVKLIVPLLSLHGADDAGVYNIVDRLIQYHGLLDGLGIVLRGDADPEGASTGRPDAEPAQDSQNSEAAHGGSQDRAEAAGPPLEGTQPEDSVDVPPAHARCAGTVLDDSTISAVWKIILEEKIDIFFQVTDLVICLGCTYTGLISRAAEISLYSAPRKIVTVLASRGNNHHYRDLLHADRPGRPGENAPAAQTYFDFLVVQNELIKGQENIKERLTGQIEALETENRRLRSINEKLKESIEQVKGQLAELEEHSG